MLMLTRNRLVKVSLGPEYKSEADDIAACELRKASWWAWFNNHLESINPPKVDFSHVHYSGPVDIRCKLSHKDEVLTSDKFMFWEFGVFSKKFNEQGKLERLSDGLKLSGVERAQRFYVELRDPKTAHRKQYVAFNEAGIAHIPSRLYEHSVIVELKKSVFYGLSSKVVLRDYGSRLPGYDNHPDVVPPSENFDAFVDKEEEEAKRKADEGKTPKEEDRPNVVPVAIPAAVPSNEEAKIKEQPSSRLSQSSKASSSSTIISGSSEPVSQAEDAPSTDAESDAGSLARMDAELTECVKEKVDPICGDKECSPKKKKNIAHRAYRYCQKRITTKMKSMKKEKKGPEAFPIDVKSELSSDGSTQSSTNQRIARQGGSEELASAASAFVGSVDRNAVKGEEDIETCVQQQMEQHENDKRRRRFSVKRAVKVCQKKLGQLTGTKKE